MRRLCTHCDVPFFAAADQGGAVGTGIEKHLNLTILASGKEQRPAGNSSPPVISGVFHFRLVPEVGPASVKDLFPFLLEQVDVGHG